MLTGLFKENSRKQFYIFVVVSLMTACIALLLSLRLLPWLYATNVHVRLHIQAPAETKVNICWDKAQIECLPLVPYLSLEKRIANVGEIADVWLSELPPRPEYAVSLIFISEGAKGIFQDLELDSSPSILWGKIPGAGVENTRLGADQFEKKDVAFIIRDGLYYFEGSLSGHLNATQEIKPGPSNINGGTMALVIWSLLFSIYLLFAIPLYQLPSAVQNLGVAIRTDSPQRYTWCAYMLCGLAIFLMFLLAINSPVMLEASDQLVYLHVALRQTWLYYPARPPGYYMFVALALWLSNYHLDGIVLLQVTLLALSVTICVWTLRKWLHPFIAIFVVFGVLFSPAQIHWSLSIMRESLFASLVLLGVTAVVAHFTATNKVAAGVWLTIFSVVCGLALLVRENGILLPVILLPVLIPEAVMLVKSPGDIWKRMQSVFQLFIRYMGPILCTGIVYIGLSTYNYVNYGYFQFTIHVTSHNFLWQEIATASFDSRSLLESDRLMSKEVQTYLGRQLYESFILARYETPGADPIYVSLFPTINQITSDSGRLVNWFQAADVINEIGRSADALIPWEAKFIGGLRQYREFVVSNPRNTGGYPLLLVDPTGLAHKQKLLSQMERSIEYNGKPVKQDSVIGQYYLAADYYEWYRPLFFLALLISIYLLRYDDPVFLAPMIFFIANALLMIVLRTEQARYIESMDVLLILQVGLGLSRWIYKHSSTVFCYFRKLFFSHLLIQEK